MTPDSAVLYSDIGEIRYTDRAVGIGIDLGGTFFKAGIVHMATGQALVERQVASAEKLGAVGWLESARTLVAEMASMCDRDWVVGGLGVASPGAIDVRRGILLSMGDRLDVGEGVSLVDAFQDVVDVPVYVDNDARSVLAGEIRWGAAAGARNCAVLTVGTGIGGAVSVDGRVLDHAVLAGNQLGHLRVTLQGPPCVCGGHGCAEVYASGSGIRARLDELGQVLSAEEAFDAAGSAEAASVIEVARLAMSVLCVNLVNAYQVDTILLSGGLAPPYLERLQELQAFVDAESWRIPGHHVTIGTGVIGPVQAAASLIATSKIHERR